MFIILLVIKLFYVCVNHDGERHLLHQIQLVRWMWRGRRCLKLCPDSSAFKGDRIIGMNCHTHNQLGKEEAYRMGENLCYLHILQRINTQNI